MTTQAIEPRMELEQNLHMYRQMAKIRAFEEQVNELYKSAKMPGLAHLYVGEEAVAVGVCEALRRDDLITSTHRGHGHCLAKGASVDRMFAELLGKEPGYCRGKGGSMHIADPETGNLGANAIVGGSAGIATGAALSAKMRGSGQVAVCFFGDGALGQGLLYEVMNMAALWKLPVIYVCENNLYGEYTPNAETAAGEILARPRAFGIHAESVDGQDVQAVNAAMRRLVERARRGEGPAFLDCKTYRYYGHHVGDINREYRTREEEREWMTERDPLLTLPGGSRARPGGRGRLRADRDGRQGRGRGRGAVRAERAVSGRERGRRGCLCVGETSHGGIASHTDQREAVMSVRELTFGEAVKEALAEEMRRDPRVFIIGEDVAEAGHPFKVLSGLVEEFGTDRVIDTPISEPGFAGIGVGAAMTGMRPVVDIMFGDFLTLTMDQIVNQAAKVHYMSGGQLKVPIVFRTTLGATRRSAAQHSQSLHAWVSHIPGLKVALPSTPYDAKGLLKTAIRDDNPVVFFEDKMMYQVKGPVPEGEYTIPFGVADIKRAGTDITIVATSSMVQVALGAAEMLEEIGISAEVIDPRTTFPLDKQALIDSAEKTPRASWWTRATSATA